jgi:hypothetical protein
MTDKIMHFWPTTWLEAAHHAGFAHYSKGESLLINDEMRDMLEKFALSIQAQEREACAQLCDAEVAHRLDRESNPLPGDFPTTQGHKAVTARCLAAAIRARTDSAST